MLASSPGVSPLANFSQPALHHEFGGAHLGVGAGEGELNALVLADGSAEHLSVLGVGTGLSEEPLGVADALGGDQQALGVHAVQDVAEAAALDADQVFRRDFHVVEEDLGRVVVHHGADRADGQAVTEAARMSTMKVDRPSVRLAV